LVKRLTRDRKVGAVAALHDLNQAAEFCDRLDLLSGGRIVVSGDAESTLTPENLLTVFGAVTRVGINPITGRTAILDIRAPGQEDPPSREPRSIWSAAAGPASRR